MCIGIPASVVTPENFGGSTVRAAFSHGCTQRRRSNHCLLAYVVFEPIDLDQYAAG